MALCFVKDVSMPVCATACRCSANSMIAQDRSSSAAHVGVVQLSKLIKQSYQMSCGCFISVNPSTITIFTKVLTSMTFGRSTLDSRQYGIRSCGVYGCDCLARLQHDIWPKNCNSNSTGAHLSATTPARGNIKKEGKNRTMIRALISKPLPPANCSTRLNVAT